MAGYVPTEEGLTPHGRVGASSTSKVMLDGNPARGEVLLSVDHETAAVHIALGSTAVLGSGPVLTEADGLLRLQAKSAISVITETEGPNEKQKITITGAEGGDFTLTLDGETTEPIPITGGEGFNLAEEIAEALEALDNVDDVTVTGEGPFTVEFKGVLATQDVPELVADASGLEAEGEAEATVAVETTVPGGVSVLFCEA